MCRHFSRATCVHLRRRIRLYLRYLRDCRAAKSVINVNGYISDSPGVVRASQSCWRAVNLLERTSASGHVRSGSSCWLKSAAESFSPLFRRWETCRASTRTSLSKRDAIRRKLSSWRNSLTCNVKLFTTSRKKSVSHNDFISHKNAEGLILLPSTGDKK